MQIDRSDDTRDQRTQRRNNRSLLERLRFKEGYYAYSPFGVGRNVLTLRVYPTVPTW